MTVEELELGHSIELELLLNGKRSTLTTTIEKVLNTSTVLVSPIRLNGKLIGFPAECHIDFLYTEKRMVYVWQDITVKPVKHNGQVYHSVAIYGDPISLNRRSSYRVSIGEEMLISMFTSEGPKPIRALVRDISETGFSFISKEDFSAGRTVRLNLAIAEDHEIRLSAQVVRIQPKSTRAGTVYGCRFIEKNKYLSSYLMRKQQAWQRYRSR